MMPFFLIRLIVIIVFFVMLTGSVVIVMKTWFRLSKPAVPPQDISENRKLFMPLRLQAYERIILYLERISPPGLIQRVSKPEMTSVQLQSALVRNIREEFEYNLSQQIYMSAKSWEMVKNAKEETIKLIHTASGKVSDGASSPELIKAILDQLVADEKHPVDFAILEIKKEITAMMG